MLVDLSRVGISLAREVEVLGKLRFSIGSQYSRADVMEQVGLSRSTRGGPWYTGIVEHDSEFFIFAGVGTTGRTGHDYQNRWEGDFFRWYHKENSRIHWPSVNRILISGSIIHLFARTTDRASFEYHGYAIPVEIVEDSSPVEILFAATKMPPLVDSYGDHDYEISSKYMEGGRHGVRATRYERNRIARQKCIDFYGVNALYVI